MKEKLIVTPEKFAAMTAKEICHIIKNNPDHHIVGYAKGVDRRIIKRKIAR